MQNTSPPPKQRNSYYSFDIETERKALCSLFTDYESLMSRRKNDFYPTPQNLTLALLEYLKLPPGERIYEPCNGLGAISEVLRKKHKVYTGDIDPAMRPDFVGDACSQWPPAEGGKNFTSQTDWVITNPPFNKAIEILEHFHRQWLEGNITTGIALLLRLSFLEPTEKRGDFLKANPPTRMLVLPRASFTEDGKTDSVTCAWMIWMPGAKDMAVFSKDDLEQLQQQQGQKQEQQEKEEKDQQQQQGKDESGEGDGDGDGEEGKEGQEQQGQQNQKNQNHDRSGKGGKQIKELNYEKPKAFDTFKFKIPTLEGYYEIDLSDGADQNQ